MSRASGRTWRSIHSCSSSLAGRRFGLPVFVPRTGAETVLPLTACEASAEFGQFGALI